MGCQVLSPGSELARCPFCHILQVKARQLASLDSRVRVGKTLPLDERISEVALQRDMETGRTVAAIFANNYHVLCHLPLLREKLHMGALTGMVSGVRRDVSPVYRGPAASCEATIQGLHLC